MYNDKLCGWGWEGWVFNVFFFFGLFVILLYRYPFVLERHTIFDKIDNPPFLLLKL